MKDPGLRQSLDALCMSVPWSNRSGVKPSHDDSQVIRPPSEITSSTSKVFVTNSLDGNYQLPDGGSYSGTLLGNMPEGLGRYSWKDGTVYTGGWRRGMMHGNGKIMWPSGCSYDGEFSGGYIHGTGTYSRLNGMSYTGRWKLNLKHGLGREQFSNGDTFEGAWMQGVIEGHGKYRWANGNVFIGNMKGGKMSGKGTLSLMNGDEYEGNWLNGMMHGFGVYTWNTGGCYVGTWTRGLKDGKGEFYPKNSRLPAIQELYINALRKRGLLPSLKRSINGKMIRNSATDMSFDRKVPNSSSSRSNMHLEQGSSKSGGGVFSEQEFCLERRWSVEVAIEKAIAHDSTANVSDGSSPLVRETNPKFSSDAPILEREYMQGVLISELVVKSKFFSSSKRRRKLEKKLVREIKRPGETIIKGYRSYDLMLSLQLGIRYSVGKITPIQRREVGASDFGPRASFWMSFPKQGSHLTPSHYADDFKWRDYCPIVFRNLREMFKIDAADYMMSVCGTTGLRQLSSPGKSGSVFFLSQDDRFMIKTLRRSEVKVLLRMLPNYYHHVRHYDNTLITKFFGLHRVKPSSGQKFRFVVMGNMFCTELRIHRRFDLKGSSLGRSSDNVEIDESTTLKDLDLDCAYYLEPSWREELLKQIEIDSKFLEMQRIMDYSMLLGVHYRAPQHLLKRSVTSETQFSVAEDVMEDETETPYPQGLVLVPRGRGCNENSAVVGSHIRGSQLRASAVGDEEVDLLVPDTARLQILLAVNMPARAEHIPTTGDESSAVYHEVYDVVLYLGIIDILQEYDLKKKIEHACKSIQFDSLSISAVDPTFYNSRFLDFIKKVFPENN